MTYIKSRKRVAIILSINSCNVENKLIANYGKYEVNRVGYTVIKSSYDRTLLIDEMRFGTSEMVFSKVQRVEGNGNR